MDVRNADDARAWLRAWNGKPRRGILVAALDGLRAAAGLCSDRHPEARKGYLEAAAAVLEKAGVAHGLLAARI